MEAFFDAMREHVPEHARIVMCQFRGDPGDDFKGKWRAHVLNDVSQIDEKANVYLCVSAMQQNSRGEFRRRKENFAGGLLLMIDDVGSGKGAKFPLDVIDPLPPSALIETSKDNFQAIYLFDRLLEDQRHFERLIKAFIDRQFLGADTGMAGVNRVFRPPAGINGKPKHDGWQVRLADFHPERRYSVDQICEAFDLDLSAYEFRPKPVGATNSKEETIPAFLAAFDQLEAADMIKGEKDLAGWYDVECPWVHEHTNAIDNGAAIRQPDPENGWVGAFKCHHAACQHRHWRDLTEWLSSEAEEVLAMVNEQAKNFEDYKT